MKTLYTGKTKDVLLDEEKNIVHLLFKDSMTGENGVFDPGSNTVGGSVEGKGKIGLAISKFFFELMEKNGIPTHYLGADVEKGLMKVRNLTVPKLEFVLRYFTAGSMCRRFSLEEGIVFDPPYAEVTLKDDIQGDPLISERLCIMKGLLKEGQYDEALDIVVKVGEEIDLSVTQAGVTPVITAKSIADDDNAETDATTKISTLDIKNVTISTAGLYAITVSATGYASWTTTVYVEANT